MEKSVILISIIVASAIALMACPRPQSTDNAAIPLPTDTVATAPDSESRGGDRGGKVAQGIRVAGKTIDKLRPHDV